MTNQESERHEIEYLLSKEQISEVKKNAIRNYLHEDRNAFDFESTLANDLFNGIGKELLKKIICKAFNYMAHEEVQLLDPATKMKEYDLSIIKIQHKPFVSELIEEFKSKCIISKTENKFLTNRKKSHYNIFYGSIAYLAKNNIFVTTDKKLGRMNETKAIKFICSQFHVNLNMDHYNHHKEEKMEQALKTFTTLQDFDFNKKLKANKDGKE